MSSDRQIESFQAGDGFRLLNAQVGQLVQAMAAFYKPTSVELNFSQELQSQLEHLLAVNWQAD